MFKNKFHVISLIVALVMGVLLIVAQIPSTQTAPKNLPIAIVDADHSSTSAAIVKQLTSVTSTGGENATTIKWSKVDSKAAVKKAMDQQKYYGALIIDANFAENAMSLASGKPINPSMNIIINQAKNPTVAVAVQNVLTMMANRAGQGVSTQVLTKLQTLNMPVPATTAKTLLNPVEVKTEIVHSTTNKTTASSSFFQPIWMGALLGSLMMMYAQKSLDQSDANKKWRNKFIELAVVAVIALIAGFGTTLAAHTILGYDYGQFIEVALFASLASFVFQLLMLGVQMWVGFIGLPIFALLMLFAAPLMALAPEMLTAFYTNWVMPWLPMRFLLDGMRSIVYYNGGLWNGNTQALIWVGVIGLGLMISSMYKPQKVRI